MKVRIMFAGDLHKKSKDITTIEGYVECVNAVQRALMSDIKTLFIDYFISLGDWYDKGYATDVAASLADYDVDLEMSRILNGNFYGLIGNHIQLNMDSNPELYIIQPHPEYSVRRRMIRAEQIMKTPKILRIGNVQISFMHHSSKAKDILDYKPKREHWAKYHVALFHTPWIIPYGMLENMSYRHNTSPTSKIGETLEGVDLAIVGDIHTPLGQFPVNTLTGTTTVIVPGSLTHTDASEESRHSSIMIPILDIKDNDRVSLSYHNFDLRINMLTFKKKNVENSREKLKNLKGKAISKLHAPEEVIAYLSKPEQVYTSLNTFMKVQGYTTMDKKLIQKVISDPGNIEELVRIYQEENMVN